MADSTSGRPRWLRRLLRRMVLAFTNPENIIAWAACSGVYLNERHFGEAGIAEAAYERLRPTDDDWDRFPWDEWIAAEQRRPSDQRDAAERRRREQN
jgi:hypothetical protein